MVDKNKFFEVILREYTNRRTRAILKTQPDLALTHFAKHNGTSLLHLAASRGNCELARLLLDAAKELGQIIVNIRDMDDNTPMHWAAMCGHLNMVKYLYKEGALLSPGNVVDTIPLSDAAGAGRTEVIKYILKYEGPDKLFKKNIYNLDAYARAVYSLQPEALKCMIDCVQRDVRLRKHLHEIVGEGFNVRDIIESLALSHRRNNHQEIHEAIQKIIHLLAAAGIVPSTRWLALSTKERNSTRTIDHAGKWKQFQKERKQQAKM